MNFLLVRVTKLRDFRLNYFNKERNKKAELSLRSVNIFDNSLFGDSSHSFLLDPCTFTTAAAEEIKL
jgi:hypothetical protein